jgi:hypothetical protein
MRWKSEYKDSYDDGIVNKSITISRLAADLLIDNEIENASGFINDLIIEALNEKDLFKKRLIGNISKARIELKKTYGVETSFECLGQNTLEVPK